MCLLLRRVLPRLESRWRWGVENRADLVIADPRSFLGWMGWVRANASGVRCALIEPREGQSSTYTLDRPFEAAQLEATLNAVSRESARSADVQPYVDRSWHTSAACVSRRSPRMLIHQPTRPHGNYNRPSARVADCRWCTAATTTKKLHTRCGHT